MILDLTMPEMDGKETLYNIRKIDKTIPVFLTSGYSEKDLASQFSEKEVRGFIQKPYDLAILKEKVLMAMEKKKT